MDFNRAWDIVVVLPGMGNCGLIPGMEHPPFACPLPNQETILLGVSGGADSLALLYSLHRAGLRLLVCHFNHLLRPQAGQDAAFVQQTAQNLGIPYRGGSADVAAHARANHQSIEEAARELRYRFLFQQAREEGAGMVAVGHTADDQAETVLMHFLRGSGLAGLKGMQPLSLLPAFDASIPLARPLLHWSRTQTEAYCRQNGLAPREDETNQDASYLRNRLRHELLPVLQAYNPQIRQTLAKTALALQGDHALLQESQTQAWRQCLAEQGRDYVSFHLDCLQKQPAAMRRNLLRQAAHWLLPNLRDVDFNALERAATLQAVDVAGGLKTLPEEKLFHLTSNLLSLPIPRPQIQSPLPLAEGRLTLSNGWALTARRISAEGWQPAPENALSAGLDADLTAGRLGVRPPRRGERFEPLGMPGKRVKLSDVFINHKIPQRFRAGWLLVTVDDEPAWVAGVRLAHPWRVSEKTRQVLQLRLEKM